jgi:hypothetical protein
MHFPQQNALYYIHHNRIEIGTEDGGLTSHILAENEDAETWIHQNLPGATACPSLEELSALANARYEAHYPDLVQRHREEAQRYQRRGIA